MLHNLCTAAPMSSSPITCYINNKFKFNIWNQSQILVEDNLMVDFYSYLKFLPMCFCWNPTIIVAVQLRVNLFRRRASTSGASSLLEDISRTADHHSIKRFTFWFLMNLESLVYDL